jgi:serine/threonine protein kinase
MFAGIAADADGPLGTPGYLAPEMIDVTKNHGRPVDMWALGNLIAEMFFGRDNTLYFKYDDPNDVDIQEDAMDRLNDVEAGAVCVNFMTRCFEIDSEARMTAEQAASHPFLGEKPITALRPPKDVIMRNYNYDGEGTCDETMFLHIDSEILSLKCGCDTTVANKMPAGYCVVKNQQKTEITAAKRSHKDSEEWSQLGTAPMRRVSPPPGFAPTKAREMCPSPGIVPIKKRMMGSPPPGFDQNNKVCPPPPGFAPIKREMSPPPGFEQIYKTSWKTPPLPVFNGMKSVCPTLKFPPPPGFQSNIELPPSLVLKTGQIKEKELPTDFSSPSPNWNIMQNWVGIHQMLPQFFYDYSRILLGFFPARISLLFRVKS